MVLLKDRESEISERSVLGVFETDVGGWTFDSKRKQIFAILDDGVAARNRFPVGVAFSISALMGRMGWSLSRFCLSACAVELDRPCSTR